MRMPRSYASSLMQCREQRVVELSRALDVDEVRTVGNHDYARMGDLGGDRLEVLGRRRRILGAGYRQRGRRDVAEPAANVVLAQDLAVAHVHLGRRPYEH